jgi:quinol monooxygenase YgiN
MARVTFISRMTVKAGREEEFVRVCTSLTQQVHAKETPVYFEFFKLREPRRYAVLESFRTEEEEHAHMNSPWLAEHVPAIVDCVDGTWEREYLDEFKA